QKADVFVGIIKNRFNDNRLRPSDGDDLNDLKEKKDSVVALYELEGFLPDFVDTANDIGGKLVSEISEGATVINFTEKEAKDMGLNWKTQMLINAEIEFPLWVKQGENGGFIVEKLDFDITKKILQAEYGLIESYLKKIFDGIQALMDKKDTITEEELKKAFVPIKKSYSLMQIKRYELRTSNDMFLSAMDKILYILKRSVNDKLNNKPLMNSFMGIADIDSSEGVDEVFKGVNQFKDGITRVRRFYQQATGDALLTFDKAGFINFGLSVAGTIESEVDEAMVGFERQIVRRFMDDVMEVFPGYLDVAREKFVDLKQKIDDGSVQAADFEGFKEEMTHLYEASNAWIILKKDASGSKAIEKKKVKLRHDIVGGGFGTVKMLAEAVYDYYVQGKEDDVSHWLENVEDSLNRINTRLDALNNDEAMAAEVTKKDTRSAKVEELKSELISLLRDEQKVEKLMALPTKKFFHDYLDGDDIPGKDFQEKLAYADEIARLFYDVLSVGVFSEGVYDFLFGVYYNYVRYFPETLGLYPGSEHESAFKEFSVNIGFLGEHLMRKYTALKDFEMRRAGHGPMPLDPNATEGSFQEILGRVLFVGVTSNDGKMSIDSLRSFGYEVRELQDGDVEEALAKTSYDVILTETGAVKTGGLSVIDLNGFRQDVRLPGQEESISGINMTGLWTRIKQAVELKSRTDHAMLAPSKILFVDDRIYEHQSDIAKLEEQGYVVETASDGFDALEIIEADPNFACVVSDVDMPVRDGIETTQKIKAINDKIKIVLQTGRAEEEFEPAELEHVDEFITLGIDDINALHDFMVAHVPVEQAGKMMVKRKILLVDDDGIDLKNNANFLRGRGYEVLTAHDGDEAVQVAQANPDIDMVLSDVNMPRMDGVESTRQINAQNDKVIIALLTANDRSDLWRDDIAHVDEVISLSSGFRHRLKIYLSKTLPVVVDKAMTAGAQDLMLKTHDSKKGGIDFNPEFLDMQIKRDGAGVSVNLLEAEIEALRLNIDGFVPIIINMTPVANIPLLLGLEGDFSIDEVLTKESKQDVIGEELTAMLYRREEI
ncbi:response regulator, partial [Candidatus Omnitrophota bacterium]